MKDYLGEKGLCIVCKESMTTISADVEGGTKLFVCEKCLETTKQNFIWICMGCGNVYIRPKAIVLKKLSDSHLKKAYQACEDLQLIQGLDRCIECDPEGIMEAVAAAKSEKGGHC
ncbi:MAG: hypothetical protein A2010_09445 [Nitrospirae bacterium GWD2_57_9]|nr:MAG: hypothetical protein A2010_09445 [Nitrospirae bacterium GWD2_57_9]OGW50567.1 MAG: hypothetical protein A2078_03170 [Nitrospirae bacterium GWC2_57_9]